MSNISILIIFSVFIIVFIVTVIIIIVINSNYSTNSQIISNIKKADLIKIPKRNFDKSKLNVAFIDFWPFNAGTSTLDLIYEMLKPFNYQKVDYKSDNIDILIMSHFGEESKKVSARCKVFLQGEPIPPPKPFDFMIGCEGYQDTDTYIHFPHYLMYPFDLFQIRNRDIARQLLSKKTKFCCFLVTNWRQKMRNEFYEKLSNYKKVDSGGPFKNNIGYKIPYDHKIMKEWISEYKFMISFENTSKPGYTTEKLPQVWNAGTIGIYWGNDQVDEMENWNPKSYVSYHTFNDMDKLVKEIIRLDNDNEAYLDILSKQLFKNNKINPRYESQNLANNFYVKMKKYLDKH